MKKINNNNMPAMYSSYKQAMTNKQLKARAKTKAQRQSRKTNR